jgi:3-deoxy-D-manno-octulosonic-acid transferase
MAVVLNFVYLMAIVALSPWLLWRRWRTGRYRHGVAAKLFGRFPFTADARRVVWFHGVSVGEIHLLATIVAAFRARFPEWRIVVSSTTDTGLAEAQKIAGATVVPWPFDFSWAVRRAFRTVRPTMLVLAEGELWPNALAIAKHGGVRTAVVNARLSPRSAGRYAKIAWLARRLVFRHIDSIGVQSDAYAQRFRSLGVSQVSVTGSVKFDGAIKPVPATALLKRIPKTDELVWVAGSTHAPEEAIVLASYRTLAAECPRLRLVLVPRHPDRFAEVDQLLESLAIPSVKRSSLAEPPTAWPGVLLLDTVGELAAAWGIADVGYVGGSLDGRRGGQSMIEPAGAGVPTVFGPHVWNFRDAASSLIEGGGAVRVANAAELTDAMRRLLADDAVRQSMGRAARAIVVGQQGATARTLDLLEQLMEPTVRRIAA